MIRDGKLPPAGAAAEPIDFGEEVRRVRAAYARRKLNNADRKYSQMDPYHFLAIQERRRAFAALVRSEHLETLISTNVLEIGCGDGGILRHLRYFSADPARTYGVDLLPEVLHEARKRSPNIPFVCGNGGQLPFGDGTFGLVFTFTLFTSVLEMRIKRSIASEAMRVLRSRGKLVWYDFVYNNPWNKDVRGIGRREIADLFPGCRMVLRRLTLAPPLGRAVSRISPAGFHLLSALKIFSSHYLCVIEK